MHAYADDPRIDIDLLGRARAGDPRALRALHDRHRDRVRAYLYRLLGPDADLDDLVQAVFARAFLALRDFRGDARLTTWLYAICANLTRNHLRGRQRRRRMLGAFTLLEGLRQDPPPGGHDLGAAAEAARLLQRLAPELREVFVLYHHEGRTLQEIAAIVGRPLSTVGDHLTRARRDLRRLAEHRPERRPAPARPALSAAA